MRSLLRAWLVPLLVATIVSPALAAWPNSPFTNLPVCTAANDQTVPVIVSDGTGGAIIAWADRRSGTSLDIYAQHVLATGAVDPAWPANGRAVCTAPDVQDYPQIASDGAGGAIVTWGDYRPGAHVDIYAQHVLATGAVDPAWPADGRALCTKDGNQVFPDIVSDGAGGAVVVWLDQRSGPTTDLYAQHVLASGVVDPAWPANGRALCLAPDDQLGTTIMSDGTGGAIVAWQDFRSGTNYDVYAQHVRAAGTLDPSWPADGTVICAAPNLQTEPLIVSDGSGGAIVAWNDSRGGSHYDVYAQHVLASGAADPAWPADGRALCTAAQFQDAAGIAADGAGGCIVSWYDFRSGTNTDIYAQHVLASGAVDPAWPADGRALCTAPNDQLVPRIVSDGVGGAIVTWYDYRSGAPDIYAHHVLASGAPDPTWPTDGRALSTAANLQNYPKLVTDGNGGANVIWVDLRAGITFDIYAQRVARHGYLGTPEAEILSVKDVPNDQGGRVKLSWNASWLDQAQDANLAAYDVYRSVPPNVAAAARERGGLRVLRGGDPGTWSRGELVTIPASATTYAWEYVQTVYPNHFASQYSVLAPTAFDSLGGSNPKTAFLVLARDWSGAMFWPSRPDSGYSTDNLPPAAPAPFTGTYAGGSVTLHWNANVEGDLAGYRLYRGTTAGFVPGPGNLVAALADAGYAGTPGAPGWYKLTAVDAHGNESAVATLLPAGTLDVAGGAVSELTFAAPAPNPAGVRTTLRYALPRAGQVRLAVYDAAGRQVRELVSGVREAGEYAEAWDLRDASGRAVSAGLYFVRFEAAGRALVQRVVVAR